MSEPNTLIFSSNPKSPSPVAIFNPVCPPIVGKIASIFSSLIIFETISGVNGSVYTVPAIPKSVWIVAGLLLTSTVSIPSSLSDLHACEPE